MRLDGGGLRSFDLRLAAYEFPAAEPKTPHDEDANWLIVEGIVDDGDRSWTFREPCFLTWEVAGLADWLAAHADGRRVGDRLSFTEPLMAFAHVDRGDGPVIRVAFDEEARPLWGPPHGPVVLEFDGSPDTLRAAADDLRQQLDRTPIRGEAPLPSDPAARPTTPGLIALLHGAMVVGGHVFDRWETVLRAILP